MDLWLNLLCHHIGVNQGQKFKIAPFKTQFYAERVNWNAEPVACPEEDWYISSKIKFIGETKQNKKKMNLLYYKVKL